MRRFVGISLSVAVLLGSGLTASAGVVSTFDTTNQGWDTVAFPSAPSYPNLSAAPTASAAVYQATGGDPGGFISKQDPDGNWQYFRAPALFLGDESAALGGSLTYNLTRLDSFSQNPLPFNGPIIAATSATTKLVYTGPAVAPTLGVWSSYNVPLVASANWKVNDPTGAVATQAQLTAVFSALTGLYIKLDYFQGSGATGEIIGLDNVNLAGAASATPEPASAATCLGGLGLILLGLRAVRRKRISAHSTC